MDAYFLKYVFLIVYNDSKGICKVIFLKKYDFLSSMTLQKQLFGR